MVKKQLFLLLIGCLFIGYTTLKNLSTAITSIVKTETTMDVFSTKGISLQVIDPATPSTGHSPRGS